MLDTLLRLIETASGTNRLRDAMTAREREEDGERKRRRERVRVRQDGGKSGAGGWMNNGVSGDSAGRWREGDEAAGGRGGGGRNKKRKRKREE